MALPPEVGDREVQKFVETDAGDVAVRILDAAGNAFGYAAILIIVAFFRELLGSGSIFNFKVFAAMGIDYVGNGVMTNTAGACLILGLLIWAQRARNGYFEEE